MSYTPFATRLLLCAMAALPLTALADDVAAQDRVERPWLVRLRAVELNMAHQSDPIGSLGVPSNAIHVSNKTIPEVDISYFFTPHWAAELVLTVPQKHHVTLENGGVAQLGTFKHLPPTLSLQYHFLPGHKFQPYVGLGINHTRISSVHVAAAGAPLTLNKSSTGLAYGLGFDYAINEKMVLNFDIKKLQLSTNVYAGGAKISRLNIDPLLIGVGIGWRF